MDGDFFDTNVVIYLLSADAKMCFGVQFWV